MRAPAAIIIQEAAASLSSLSKERVGPSPESLNLDAELREGARRRTRVRIIEPDGPSPRRGISSRPRSIADGLRSSRADPKDIELLLFLLRAFREAGPPALRADLFAAGLFSARTGNARFPS